MQLALDSNALAQCSASGSGRRAPLQQPYLRSADSSSATQAASLGGRAQHHRQGACRHSSTALQAAVVEFPAPPQSQSSQIYETVRDAMTSRNIVSVTPQTSIDEALDVLVEKKVAGLPVVDSSNRVVGVVSDYDLLSLDSISGKMQAGAMFPEASQDWQAFFAIQKLVLKNAGRTVEDVMTSEPITVREDTNLEAAARILLEQKVRRLPVVDPENRLVGVFTRRDMIVAALRLRKAADQGISLAQLQA